MPRVTKSCEQPPCASCSRLRVCWVRKRFGRRLPPLRAHWRSGHVHTADSTVQTAGCRLYLQLQKASIDVSEVIKNECEHFSDALRNTGVVDSRLWPFPSTHANTSNIPVLLSSVG